MPMFGKRKYGNPHNKDKKGILLVMGGDEDRENENDEGEEYSEEAQIEAARGVMRSIKMGDAEGTRDALKDFLHACGLIEGEARDEENDEEANAG